VRSNVQGRVKEEKGIGCKGEENMISADFKADSKQKATRRLKYTVWQSRERETSRGKVLS
jgi:hypothetical protein